MTNPSVLFASAELAPLARVGGLAEAAAGLVHALRAQDVSITPVLPDYGDVELRNEESWAIPTPDWTGPARARRGDTDAFDDIILVDFPGMRRPHPYVDPTTGEGWPDNDHRFIAFSAAVAELCKQLQPDVLHLNDWHTAGAMGFFASAPPTVLTIHTLGYQGVASASWLSRWPHESWRYAWYDVANPLVGAIRSVDRIVAVSPSYAEEILVQETGMGMHEELARRGDALVGIRNGIDTNAWNPATDPHIVQNYGVKDVATGKAAARASLNEEAGWPDDRDLLIAVVSRLVDQKGIDWAMGLAPYLDDIPARIFVLGSGQLELTELVERTAAAYPDRIHAVVDRYDEPLAHRLFAGADVFLMPSRFEPCGLAQMQAMAYGTPTIATAVGGLRDTIVDIDADPKSGTGVLATTNDVAGLVDAVHRASRAFKVAARRKAMQKRGMTADWSWEEPARQHLDLYRDVYSNR